MVVKFRDGFRKVGYGGASGKNWVFIALKNPDPTLKSLHSLYTWEKLLRGSNTDHPFNSLQKQFDIASFETNVWEFFGKKSYINIKVRAYISYQRLLKVSVFPKEFVAQI